MNVATGLALLAAGGTAAAARTGTLPDDAQRHAHRLFSALGVPAPRTGPSADAPAPSSRPVSPDPPGSTSRPAPAPTPGGSITASRAAVVPAGWCRAWSAKPKSTKAPWWPELVEAAGGEDRVAQFCAGLTTAPGRPSATPGATPSPSSSVSPSPSTPVRTKPGGRPSNLPTPNRPTKTKDKDKDK